VWEKLGVKKYWAPQYDKIGNIWYLASRITPTTCPYHHLFLHLLFVQKMISAYFLDHFSPNYKLTIGVDFSLKALQWDDKTKINLQLW